MPSTRADHLHGWDAGGIDHDSASHRLQEDETPAVPTIDVSSAEREVYEALRRQIIHGLPPGTPLRLAQLANQFDVSTMPVRAAVSRLRLEGLVAQRPRRGAVVSELSPNDFNDMYAIRMALEGVAARCGSINLTDAQLVQMRSCLQTMASLELNDDAIDRYLPLDWRLHDICYDASDRPKLLLLIHTFRRQSERYFRRYLNDRIDYSGDIERQEAFVRACEDRDPDRAESAIRNLFNWTAQTLFPVLAGGS